MPYEVRSENGIAVAAMAVLLMDMNLIAEEEDLNINSWTVRHWHFTSLHSTYLLTLVFS